MNLRNKFFIILSISLLFILTVSNLTYASFDFTFNDKDYSFPDIPVVDGYSKCIITSNNLYLFPDNYKAKDVFSVKYNGYDTDWYISYSFVDSGVYLYDLNSENFTWDFYKLYKSQGSFSGILYSSFDIYDTEGNLVFQGALPQAVTIPTIQQVEEIPQVVEQALMIIIPVGLIVFSIGFVIYLTRLVISRVQ